MHFSTHLVWLWFWFLFGMMIYMLKRAYYLVTGPNPVANTYKEFIEKCWIPLLVRFVVDSGIFWLMFYPDILNPIISKIGFSFQLHSPISQMPAPVCLFVGLGIDSLADMGVSKIPWFKDWLPQMPPGLKELKQAQEPTLSKEGS